METIPNPKTHKTIFLNGIPTNDSQDDSHTSSTPPSGNETSQGDFDFEFLQNPRLTKLSYLEKSVPLYSNLYKIKLSKNYILYEYAIKFQLDNEHIPNRQKRKVFAKITKEISEKFGVYLYTGDAMFATTEIKEVVNVISIYKKFKYSILIQPTKEKIEMTDDSKYMTGMYTRKPEVKTILELIIKDILRHNPSLKFVKNLYGKKHAEKSFNAYENYNGISIMPGFSTKIMFLEDGIYLNVDIKNKILSSYHCLDLINSFIKTKGKVTRDEIQRINVFFKGRTVETIHTNQRFKVEMVNFEKRAKDCEITFENSAVAMTKYYKNLFDIDIDPQSPLLLIKSKGKNDQQIGRFFPPQLCLLVGLTDEMLKDHTLIQSISKFTKQTPEDKVQSLNDIIKLVNEKKGILKRKKIDGGGYKEHMLKSSYEKKEEYGIEIVDVTGKSKFVGYIMNNPIIKGAKEQIITNISKPFPVLDSKKINFLCVYHKLYESEKIKLAELITTAGKNYGISVGKAEYKPINSENPEEWIKLIEKSVSSAHNLVIVLLDDYLKAQGLYDPIKKHSIERKGYITQFIVTTSLWKNSMSIMSNILLQVNTKIGGASYKVDFDPAIKKKNLMVIGVDSSRMVSSNGQPMTLIAFCASLNATFTEYTHKKIEIETEGNENINLPISTFIYEAIAEYFKLNKKTPSGIVIYRQGVSKEQKQYLSDEIEQIHSLLNGGAEYELLSSLIIPYYYILVNKKTSLKFFEYEALTRDFSNVSCSSKKKTVYSEDDVAYQYDNPDSGLLVYNHITDPRLFEFYIQPQKVNQGTATPTSFHVAFGTMECPEIVPKLTYDLCYLYSNWRGPVRVPAPLKYAEKLAKVTPKIHEKLKNCLAYI